MTTRRALQRKTTATKPQVVTLQERARRLPMFGPGIVITVAGILLPAYYQVYDLVPMTRAEVSAYEQRHHVRKPDGIVWVKRVPKDKKNV